MTNMDGRVLLKRRVVDRLSNLSVELSSQILSMIPTKDAAALQVLSKAIRRAFTLITSVDLDDSPVSVCPHKSYLAKRSTLFESFIDNLFQKLSDSRQSLTHFRLFLGGDKTSHDHVLDNRDHCDETVVCFSDLEPNRLSEWISYPISHYGLKELDISFHVINPSDCELPKELFTCRSLEVMKLDCNLRIDGDKIPRICLPSLKLLHLRSFVFYDDEFITSLISSCPALEDLSITFCFWEILDHVAISSHSLRSLVLDIWEYDDKQKNSHPVLIDAPSLQYLNYEDYLASSYSVAHTNDLVEARIKLWSLLHSDSNKTYLQSQLSLITALSNVQHLSLFGCCSKNVTCVSGELLPMFRKLRTLKLDVFFNARWDMVLLVILQCSPVLETLAFPKGLCVDIYGVFHSSSESIDQKMVAKEEAEAWRTIQEIPSCFESNLKRVEIASCFVTERELNMIHFFLRNALVLKELVILKHKTDKSINQIEIHKALNRAPRASNSCSITVE